MIGGTLSPPTSHVIQAVATADAGTHRTLKCGRIYLVVVVPGKLTDVLGFLAVPSLHRCLGLAEAPALFVVGKPVEAHRAIRYHHGHP